LDSIIVNFPYLCVKVGGFGKRQAYGPSWRNLLLIPLSAVGRTSCTPWIDVEGPRAGFEVLTKSKVSSLAGDGKTVLKFVASD